MAQINVNNLTFYYEGSSDHIFENVSFSIDTDWKLGFIGRNGKGKTTFLNLLLGKYEYTGSISMNTVFDYFPYRIKSEYLDLPAAEFVEELKLGCEQWRIICELDKLGLDAEVLYRPFDTLSLGERTKVMLAVLFSGENDFLLIDEPTNHLDQESREMVKAYLAKKKGFILVSHDRDLLDACIDHVLVLNRHSIEVQSGNFSSWWENKSRKDAFAQMENEKHRKEIVKLRAASERTRRWADKNESTKIGFDPVKEPDRCKGTRAYIGAKTKKMQSRVKQMEVRIHQEIEEKEGLLQDIENPVNLKMLPMNHYKKMLIMADHYGLKYTDAADVLFDGLNFDIYQGERVFLKGANGCGKSSLIKTILYKAADAEHGLCQTEYGGELYLAEEMDLTEKKRLAGEMSLSGEASLRESGTLRIASGLRISYINQDISFLHGSIKEFCKKRNLDESLFCAILRQLDMERVQFAKNIEDYSEGQKKKVLIAASLLTPAHLYIWDEPLNYIDVFSRMQIERLLLAYHPTMLVVEHDERFREKIATKTIEIKKKADEKQKTIRMK
ncbi:ATP-binding cassette domain-containing protein [Bariatricus sp. SGI.154]|uniref:ATP-binding cassette domain-containing protein n=1 Tax=Bariatricus sp. SGI.154 TaxID=3420549 RepID=UPI003CFF67D0